MRRRRSSVDDWLRYLDGVIEGAAPEELAAFGPVKGFDGDAWVWIWREETAEPSGSVVEVRIAARPDTMDPGAEVWVTAMA